MTYVSACPACAAAPLAEDVAKQVTPPNMFLSLPTIHCAACIGAVERALAKVSGVVHARVNLSLKRVAILADGVSVEEIVGILDQIGYEAHPLDPALIETRQDDLGRALLIRLAVAGFAMMNVMLFSVAVWSGASEATRDLFHLISAAISLPAVLFSGQPFFSSAWSALRVRALNMDVPISLAILLAAGMSLFEVLNSGAHAYFDAALSLTFFLLIGRYLDHRTRSAAKSAAKDLAALEVNMAQLITGGVANKTPVAQLCVGDTVLVPTGARVPVDGDLASPAASTDRSFLTGETTAFSVKEGAPLQAGEINLGAAFQMRVTAVGEDTTLSRVVAMVEMAENSRNRYTNLADRAARIYAPAVHLLALFAFVGWVLAYGDLRHALNVAVAILIITCPCALGLAVPAVATAAISKLYGMGFLVKNGSALERLAEIDTAIFDKTGTLTITGARSNVPRLSAEQVSVARALAQSSDHPAARAVLEGLPTGAAAELSDLREVPGSGVQARWSGKDVRLGRGSWLEAEFEGTGLRIGVTDAIRIGLTETLRPGAKQAVTDLGSQGIELEILSGDGSKAVQSIAKQLGVSTANAEIDALAKHAHLTELAESGRRVLMVGDGLNDTASLAAAHASVAPSSALDASRNAADIVLLRDSLSDLPRLLAVARLSTQLSKQNFAIAALYNCIAVPIALLGYATPLIAAIAMSASSITVLANAMRVRAAS
ncbi:heavy metal translocating P-type ATPase [uncultured Litoreibacter sp.]|uniref:heavy metal translocating P-type ATPase n=1 Tax=uncultured Litoreibacter sp. TaxID=1392394 RepID=UPI00261D6D52|nr:heavy metal translocating P-type ATPase [uncultured Litoreibacter sp.]